MVPSSLSVPFTIFPSSNIFFSIRTCPSSIPILYTIFPLSNIFLPSDSMKVPLPLLQSPLIHSANPTLQTSNPERCIEIVFHLFFFDHINFFNTPIRKIAIKVSTEMKLHQLLPSLNVLDQ